MCSRSAPARSKDKPIFCRKWVEHSYSGSERAVHALRGIASIDQIPVFVRAGAILAIGSDLQSTATRQTIAAIKVYPGKDGDFALYDDDGTSYDYEKGKGTVTHPHGSDATKTISGRGDGKGLIKSAPALLKIAGQ